MIRCQRCTRAFGSFLSQPSREALVDLKNLVDTGALRPVVERSYPLDEDSDALRHVESGAVAGKIALTLSST